jgi:CelD/BcsL family acetyltransferase involved in cellulose biosynthesis
MTTSVATDSSLRVEPLPDLPGGEEEWKQVGHECGNPFTTWEWAATWWRHYGEGRPQRILGCRDEGGALVGVLPLYLAARRPLRVLRFVGHGFADQLGPVCAPGRRAGVAAAFGRALADDRGWSFCVAERLSAAEGWRGLIDGTVTRSEPSPTIRFDGADWEGYLASRSSNFRQQARRMERRLARGYELNFRLASDPARLEDDMDLFFRLHYDRWAGAGGSGAFIERRERFHRELVALALREGWLRLSFLELDGVPRAALYCFRLGGADWYYQAGRDPDFERQRVGYVLLNNAVREAANDGMSEFKLLLGEHGYKSRYTDDETPVETFAIARNAALATALRLGVPLRDRLRSLRSGPRPERGGGA